MKLRWFAVFVTITLAILAIDQGTKSWAHGLPVSPASCHAPADLAAHRCAGVPQPVIGGFWDWELAYNDGAAFSTLTGTPGGRILLSLVAALALLAVGAAAAATPPSRRLRRIGYGLVAGGALGNLLDRVRDGAVTDFVRWHLHGHAWPVFNVADAAILIGGVLLITEAFSGRRRGTGRTVPA